MATPSALTTRPDQPLADGNLDDAARPLDDVALADAPVVAQNHRADVVFFEVERHAHDAAGELQKLRHGAVLKAVDAGDAVTDL